MKRSIAAAGWCLLVLLPVAAGLARLAGHPGAFFDGEASIPATIGRELHLCGADLVFHYQLIPYQGSLVLDSLLSSVGYGLFGDHLLAWHAVPLLWLLMASVAGTWVLFRATGVAGAVAWPLLLATAPFLVKDGLVSGIGGHASAPAWGLAALAVALAIDPERRATWGLAVLAGAVLALGTWHTRSAALAGPALVLVCLRGGWRALLGLALGLLLFPLLFWLNLHALLEGGTFWTGTDPGDLARRALIPGAQLGEGRPLLTKLGEALGWSPSPLFFWQPADWQGAAPTRPGAVLSGRLVAVAWLMAVPVIVGVLARHRRRARSDDAPRLPLLPLAALLALVLAWPAAYAARDFTVEQSVLSLLSDLQPGSPGPTISATRYLVPAFVCALLGLATAVGLCWRGPRLRLLALALICPPLLLGGWHGLADWVTDRDDPSLLTGLDPFFYPGITLSGRMPPAEVHLRCLSDDPSSFAYHVEGLAAATSPGLGRLGREPELAGQSLKGAIVAAGDRLGARGRARLARACGRRIGQEAGQRQGARRVDGVQAALEAHALIEPTLAPAWLVGFVEAFEPPLAAGDPGEHLARLCDDLPAHRRPGSCPP